MYKYLIILLFLFGCPPVPQIKIKYPKEVIESCKFECSNYKLFYRNKNSLFCECVDKKLFFVISNGGTIFK